MYRYMYIYIYIYIYIAVCGGTGSGGGSRAVGPGERTRDALYEEFTRLAETRLAQNNQHYFKLALITLR